MSRWDDGRPMPVDDDDLDAAAKFDRQCRERDEVRAIGQAAERRARLIQSAPAEVRGGPSGPLLDGTDAWLKLHKQREDFEAEDRRLRIRFSCVEDDD